MRTVKSVTIATIVYLINQVYISKPAANYIITVDEGHKLVGVVTYFKSCFNVPETHIRPCFSLTIKCVHGGVYSWLD